MELGVFMFRSSINDLPNAFKDFFSRRSQVHDYQTRHVNNYNITFNKKSFSDRAIRTTGPILWNSLHESLKESKTIKHFRKNMKETIIHNYKFD